MSPSVRPPDDGRAQWIAPRSLTRIDAQYVDGQRIYFARARPWERASIVVDNPDVIVPRILDTSWVRAGRPSGIKY
jgi:hypothetical protein